VDELVDVENTSGRMIVGQNDHFYICYIDRQENDLKLAEYDGQAWNTSTIVDDPAGNAVVGRYCSIIEDNLQNLHILYLTDSNSNTIRHVYQQEQAWIDEHVADNVRAAFSPVGSSRISVALNGNNKIAMAVYDSSLKNLMYIEQLDNDTWDVQTLVSNGDVGRYASIAFDLQGNPIIIYSAMEFDAIAQRSFARLYKIWRDGDQWQTSEQISTSGSYNDFLIDAQGRGHLIYSTGSELYYRRWVDDQWQGAYLIDRSTYVGMYCNMYMDVAGNLFIVYQDKYRSALFPDLNQLKLASLYFQTTDWFSSVSTETITFSGMGQGLQNQYSPSIGITDDYQMRLTWLESYDAPNNETNHRLKIAALRNWQSRIALITPNADDHDATEEFDFEWYYFDPENESTIQIHYYQDFNDQHVFQTNIHTSNQSLHEVIDVADLVAGSYTIKASITDDANPSVEFNAVHALEINNRVPNQPSLVSPEHEATVTSALPDLTASTVTDLDGDDVVYVFQVYRDDAGQDLVTESADIQVVPGADDVVWRVDIALDDGNTYYWRVRAVDEHDNMSDWTDYRSFDVDIAHAPTQPKDIQINLANHAMRPIISWDNSVDIDDDDIHYNAVICIDQQCATVFISDDAVIEDFSGRSSWQIDQDLDAGDYYTRVRAIDITNSSSIWSTTIDFQIDVPVQEPEEPEEPEEPNAEPSNDLQNNDDDLVQDEESIDTPAIDEQDDTAQLQDDTENDDAAEQEATEDNSGQSGDVSASAKGGCQMIANDYEQDISLYMVMIICMSICGYRRITLKYVFRRLGQSALLQIRSSSREARRAMWRSSLGLLRHFVPRNDTVLVQHLVFRSKLRKMSGSVLIEFPAQY